MTKSQLSNRELSAFCAQIAMLLKAGISIEEGISMMLDDTETQGGKEILASVLASCSSGNQLSDALAQSNAFPKYMLDMVEIGEISGQLDKVMSALAEYYMREQQISDNLRNAIRYPAVMTVMMLAVVVVLVVKVMPVFEQVFIQLGSEMSGVSAAITRLGAVMSQYSLVLMVVAAVLLAFVFYCSKTENGKRVARKMAEKLWITKGIYSKIADARFSSGLSLMLSSGIDSDKSLEMVKSLVSNEAAKEKIKKCQGLVEGGESLESALVKAGLFSGLYARMVTIGFKTGNADEVMRNVAQNISDEVDVHINNKISLIEPSLVAVFSVIVGMILLSVMLPLMGIMSFIG